MSDVGEVVRPLDGFIGACRSVIRSESEAADRVTAIAPLMQGLLAHAGRFLD